MNEHVIQVNISIEGYEDIANFIVDLLELVRDYQGKIEFTDDSDVQVDLIDLTEEDYPSEITLKDYLGKELN